MLALADYADENGRAWPSYETLARKCRTSRRNIIKTIDKLETDGELVIEQRTSPRKKPRADQPESRWHASNVYHLRPGGDALSLCDMVNSSTPPMVNSSTPESSIETSKEAVRANPSVEAATRVSARAEKIAAAAAGPDPSKTGSVSVERHALIDAWALAHRDAGRAAVITSDLQALAEALAAEGVTADELRQMVTDKLAARDDDYSFRFIRQDFAAWRNARYRAQSARTDSPPARAQAPQARRYEAEAWTPPAAPVPAVPALFDARYRAIFEKAWLTLSDQGHNDVTIRMNWRHLAALKLMDSDGTRYTLATESPAAKDCTQRWLKNIERVLFDAGAPRDVVAEVLSADEWREWVKETTRQPAATAAAASF